MSERSILNFVSNSIIDNYVLWLLKILLGLCLIIPLFISSSLLFPYTAPKAFAFRILVEIAAVFYFYLVLKKSPLITPPFNKGGRGGGILTLAVLAFLTIYLLSAFFGVDFYSSFWGNLERMLGFWGLLHFVLFFLMLVGIFKTQKEWLMLLKVSVGVSSLVALLAILQKFTGLGLLIPQADRVYSTIGNAAFLGTYLVFNIFFVGYLLIFNMRPAFAGDSSSANWRTQNDKLKDSHSDPERSEGEESLARATPKASARRAYARLRFSVWFLTLAINIIALFLTQTRGAILGLAIGGLFCLVMFVFFSSVKNLRRWSRVTLIIMAILASLLFVFRNSAVVKNNSLLRRLTSVSLSDTTTQNRLILWQKSWIAWQEKPIFGWGPENYQVAANLFFDPRLNPYEAWYDRAHNFIFDYGVSGGWLGLIAYLTLAGVAFFCLRDIGKSNQTSFPSPQMRGGVGWGGDSINNFHFSALFSGLLIAYLVQNFFVFDTFISFLMLFFTLAIINFYYELSRPAFAGDSSSRQGGTQNDKKRGSRPESPAGGEGSLANDRKNISFSKKIILVVFAVIIVFSIYLLNLKAISASRLANQILSLPTENLDQIEPLFGRALSLKTFASNEITYQIVLDYLDKIKDNPQLTQNEKFYTLSSTQLQKNIKQFPYQSRNYVALAWLNLYFSGAEPSRIDEAITQGKKAKQLSPAKKDAYLILVAGYFLKGEFKKAEEIITQAKAISPDLGQEVSQYWQNLK